MSSPKRWALMHELGDEPEMSFDDVLAEAGTCDLILVEGFKREPFPKIEIRRDGGASRQPLAERAADRGDRLRPTGDETESAPVFHLDDIDGMADFITDHLEA